MIRIGREKSRTQQWGISTDSTATFAPEWAGELLKEMANADTFLAQVTPYNESPVIAIFDTRGMTNALKPLAETCRWDQGKSKPSTNARKTMPVPTADPSSVDDEFSGLLRSVERMDSTD